MNPVVGDRALAALGRSRPDAMTEVEKIRCHVSYALEQLKTKTSVHQQERRAMILANLDAYVAKGLFPRSENAASPDQRHPCFMDSSGTPCAVAHLMQQSGAMALANAIASSHKHDSIAQIAEDEELSPQIKSWAFSNGLSVQDLALIQPTYEFVAKQARALFEKVEAQLLEASSTSLSEDKRNNVSNLMVQFGDTMVSGFGYPLGDIPNYLKRIKKLEERIPVESAELRRLLELLRKEVQGAEGRNGTRPTAADYEGLLSSEDLDFMKKSICSNMRVERN